MTRDVVVKLLRTMKEFGESEITHTFMGNEPNEISISFDREGQLFLLKTDSHSVTYYSDIEDLTSMILELTSSS
ncbi:hypothetical protein AF331_05550 [Rossellomorea marisflavi]|jgi:hypothetical protein|uniref:Uncharacterized protein n=1 Tax=Rossellomorea marisflavi TaxID=189381 RepID=A0A0M0GR70_9BACI|nr:hypothetical protein [Rossellomorea marisflavi]KON91936.1 hypothetical protein AF331_05550 [Rossellomorea marisflavi]MDR4936976.1 hypothetical protein [Rossellomorea marisflavi]VXB06223.1 conserved hypothetical protein [Bacillus sp. 349Y]